MLKVMFAGLWPLIWHYGLGFGCVILALAFAWFSPVFKKTALWVAAGFAIGTICYAVGVNNGEYRVQSKWDAAERETARRGDKIREEAERAITVEPDPEPDPTPVPDPRPVVKPGGVRHHKLDKYDRG